MRSFIAVLALLTCVLGVVTLTSPHAAAQAAEDQPGTVTLQGDLQVGSALSASLSDADTVGEISQWQWSRSTLPDADFVDIDGAVSASYSVTSSDSEFFLRASASYSDGHGSAKHAVGTSAMPIGITATTLFDNDDPEVYGAFVVGSDVEWAFMQSFETGDDPNGYVLNSILCSAAPESWHRKFGIVQKV